MQFELSGRQPGVLALQTVAMDEPPVIDNKVIVQ
jgi:hypothetical protein